MLTLALRGKQDRDIVIHKRARPTKARSMQSRGPLLGLDRVVVKFVFCYVSD